LALHLDGPVFTAYKKEDEAREALLE